MRDRRFVAEHRGGSLTLIQHQQLMQWAIACAAHVLPLLGDVLDPRLQTALDTAEAWAQGEATVGMARAAAVAAHTVARESSSPTAVAVARAVGHAVATAHMADHALGPALYGLKAVAAEGGRVEAEREWQISHLPADIKELVLSALGTPKFKKFYELS